jgi:hypothetical protein
VRRVSEVARPPLGRIVFESLCVAAATLAYLWLWRLYGFDVVDEGTQLLQISRAAGGALPYTDFETGYTPGYFTLQSWLWQSGGFVAIRTMLVFVHAGVAATVYALLRDSGGRTSACVGVAMFVAYLLPISLDQGAPLNIPYPGWLALPAVLMSVALLAELGEGHSARRNTWGVFLAGLGAAFAFAVKPNTGLFLLGGAALAVAASWRTTHPVERWCSWLLRGTAAGAVVLLVYPVLNSRLGLALLVPAFLAVVVAGPVREGGRRTALPDLATLCLGFLLPTLPWLGVLSVRIGFAETLESVFFVGEGGRAVVNAYALAAPEFRPGMLVLTGTALVAMSLARSRAARLVPGLLLVGACLGLYFAFRGGMRPLAENILFWTCPIALSVGLLTVGSGEDRQRERTLLILASFLFLTVYPRPDLIHVAQIGPVILLAGMSTWRRSSRDWFLERRRDGLLHYTAPGVLTGVFLLLAVGRMGPTLMPRLSEPLVSEKLGPGFSVEVLESRAAPYRAMAEVVARIRQETQPGEAIFTFPDLAGLALLADRPSPFYYVYFVPGRPDATQALRVEAAWPEVRPVLAVLGEPRVPVFVGAPEYFQDLMGFVHERSEPLDVVSGVTLRRVAP